MNIFGPPHEGGVSRPFTDREQQAIAAMLATEAATCLAARNADRRQKDMPIEVAGRKPRPVEVRTRAQEWAGLGQADRIVLTALMAGPKGSAQSAAETGAQLWAVRDAGRRLQVKGLTDVTKATARHETYGHVVNVYEITGKGRSVAAEAGKQGLQREVEEKRVMMAETKDDAVAPGKPGLCAVGPVPRSRPISLAPCPFLGKRA